MKRYRVSALSPRMERLLERLISHAGDCRVEVPINSQHSDQLGTFVASIDWVQRFFELAVEATVNGEADELIDDKHRGRAHVVDVMDYAMHAAGSMGYTRPSNETAKAMDLMQREAMRRMQAYDRLRPPAPTKPAAPPAAFTPLPASDLPSSAGADSEAWLQKAIGQADAPPAQPSAPANLLLGKG